MIILHSFLGVFVNTLTVILGSVVGLVLKKQIPEKLTNAVMTTIGLCTIAIGIGGIIKSACYDNISCTWYNCRYTC